MPNPNKPVGTCSNCGERVPNIPTGAIGFYGQDCAYLALSRKKNKKSEPKQPIVRLLDEVSLQLYVQQEEQIKKQSAFIQESKK